MKRFIVLFLIFIIANFQTPVIGNSSQIVIDKKTVMILQQSAPLAMVNPVNGSTLGDLVTIDLSNTTDFENYEIWIDGVLRTNSSRYYWDADTASAGSHTILGRAWDGSSWTEVNHVVTVDPNYVSGVFKLLTYNIGESGKYGDWVSVVKEENADIAVLQETGGYNRESDPAIQSIISDLNGAHSNKAAYEYRQAYEPSPTAAESILSRYPIIEFNAIRNLQKDDGTPVSLGHILLEAVVKVGFTYIYVFTEHLNCCDSGYKNRVRDQEAIINYFDSLGDVPIIYAGDMNSATSEDDAFGKELNLGTVPLDMLWNSSSPHSSEVHEFQDVYRSLHPFDFGATYIDNQFDSRLDYIYVNQYFLGMPINSTSAQAPSSDIGSDHFPLNAWINLDDPEIDLTGPLPVQLDASSVTTSSISLTWSSSGSADVDHYNIYRDDNKLSTSMTTSYNDSDISDNTIYRFQVSATDNSSNEGILSQQLIINSSRGILTPPSQPTNLKVEFVDGANVLTWEVEDDGGLPITNYAISRTSAAGMKSNTWIIYGESTEAKYVDNKVTPSIKFFYRVVAFNELGRSPNSQPIGFTVPIVSTTTESTTTESATTESTKESKSPVNINWVLIGFFSQVIMLSIIRKHRKLK